MVEELRSRYEITCAILTIPLRLLTLFSPPLRGMPIWLS